MFAVFGRIAEGSEAFLLEGRNRLGIRLEIDRVAGDKSDHSSVDENPGAAEHATHRHWAKFLKQFDNRVGFHEATLPSAQCASAPAVSAAGVSCTDSPQPQAEVWFGLLNTKVEDS